MSVISIHAPVKGATQGGRREAAEYGYFNPRTREGCDYSTVDIDVEAVKFQSTHP